VLGIGLFVGLGVRSALARDRAVMHPWLLWSTVIAVMGLTSVRDFEYLGPAIGGLFWSTAPAAADSMALSPKAWAGWVSGGLVALGASVWLWGHPPWAQFLRNAYDPSLPAAQWLRTHPHPGLLFVNQDFAGILEQEGVHHLFVDGRIDFFLRYSHRAQLETVWFCPHLSHHLSLARTLQQLQHLGVTRWMAPSSTPTTLAERQALQAAHWTPVAHPGTWTLWQAPSSSPFPQSHRRSRSQGPVQSD